jgi:hypothetical protein
MDHSGQFQGGWLHPYSIDLRKRENHLRELGLGTLTILEGSIRRGKRSRMMVSAICSACEQTFQLHVDNVLSGKTKSCRCQRGRKYHDARADLLGPRYDAMVQRCERDTHVSSHNYRGRGIRVEFRSREHFIRWALEKWPDTDFRRLDFDRIDNDGNYSPENLRLVTRSVNLLNRRQRR